MRPRINTPTPLISGPVFSSEVYTIHGHKDIFFYRRVEAILKTKEVAKAKQTTIVMLLNGTPFIEFKPTGKYSYIYNPNNDKKTDPYLKQLFIQKGYTIAA